VEEPQAGGPTPRLAVTRPAPGVIRCVPHLPRPQGFDDAATATLAALVRGLLARERIGTHVAWLYTPMALPLALALRPEVLAWDCMDELSAFHGAPDGLLERERLLLERADVVFTGGPSLYRAKRDRHPDVHCLPSSVDAAHYGRARDGLPEPPAQATLPRPRFGFFGVLDERLDLALLAHVADARPDWAVVLVGPVVKIDPATLPRRPNLHYLGQQPYEALPAHVAGWDVCLLPFAQNAATRFISPTKTLEYMAAGRPIVSTPIRDVAEPYGGVVHLGATPAEFLTACENALREGPHARAAAMQAIVDATSWDATVASMDAALTVASRRRNAARGGHSWELRTSSSSVPARPA
jgi:UDP-galactopyranose mutase